MTLILGIDPGVKGGWAVVNKRACGEIKLLDFALKSQRLPCLSSIRAVSDTMMAPHWEIFLEKVHAMPAKNDGSSGSNAGQGVVSMFSFGREFGFWLGFAGALGFEPRLISPQRWQKTCLLAPPERQLRKLNEAPAESRARALVNRKAMKKAIQDYVCTKYPMHSELKMVKYEGVCDAIGIALYGAGLP